MPVKTCQLTRRDEDLLDVLTKRVRVLGLQQVAAMWWQGQERSLESASRRVAALETVGFLRTITGFAHPELSLVGPLLRWHPGEPAPDLGSIAYRLQARWTEPLRLTRGVIATKLAAAQQGGIGGRAPRLSELTHDLHLAAVFIRLRREDPQLAMTWQSEAGQYAEGGGRDERLPDAMIGVGRERMAIEFGGAYAKRKLEEFHDHCAERAQPYEVW